MDWILNTYIEYKNWIELTKDAVFLAGAITLVKILWHKRFTDRAKEIKENLEFRDRIESNLNDYVREKAKNKVSIAVRFVHWKNYPHNLNNDAFPHKLFIYPHEDNVLPSGYIDNTGINFEVSIWWLSNSTYVDKTEFSSLRPKDKVFQVSKKFLTPYSCCTFHLSIL